MIILLLCLRIEHIEIDTIVRECEIIRIITAARCPAIDIVTVTVLTCSVTGVFHLLRDLDYLSLDTNLDQQERICHMRTTPWYFVIDLHNPMVQLLNRAVH